MPSSAYLGLQADLYRRLSRVTGDDKLRVPYAMRAQLFAAEAECVELGRAPSSEVQRGADDSPIDLTKHNIEPAR
jgi:hypothetical protein